MQEFIESQLFANICSAFSAVGTVGAVIISLYLILRDNKIKYKMTGNTITMMNPFTNDVVADGYGINIVNLSFNKNMMLKQSLYVKCPKGKVLLLLVNLKLPKEFITPSMLSPGENFTFLIEKKQIREILDKVKSKMVTIYFMDQSNLTYKLKVKRSELEKIIEK